MLRRIVLFLSFTLLANVAMAAGATKVAILDLQAVVLSSDAGKGGMQQLESNPEYGALKAKMENLEEELKSLDEKGKNESLTWSEDQKTEHKGKMLEIAKQRQAGIMELNRARENVFMQMLNAMEPAIGKVLEDIMAKEGIELVLDSKAVIHKVATADITPMVVNALNKLSEEAKKENEKAKGGKKQDKSKN